MPTSRFVSGHSNQQVFGPSNVIHDRMTVVVPAVDTKSELGSVHHHLQTETPHGGRAKRGFTQTQIHKHRGTAWARLTNAGGGNLFPQHILQTLVGRRNARKFAALGRLRAVLVDPEAES